MTPLPNEPEVLEARLAFPDGQDALNGVPESAGAGPYTLSWYGTQVHDERGSFGLVNAIGPLADLVGDRVQILYKTHSVRVYVFGSTDLDTDIAITRRAFASIELLAKDSINVRVQTLIGEVAST